MVAIFWDMTLCNLVPTQQYGGGRLLYIFMIEQ